MHELLITKGTHVCLGLSAANRSTAIWGPDAAGFRPERWMDRRNVIDQPAKLPSVYSNMCVRVVGNFLSYSIDCLRTNRMTFLGGGRACPCVCLGPLRSLLLMSFNVGV